MSPHLRSLVALVFTFTVACGGARSAANSAHPRDSCTVPPIADRADVVLEEDVEYANVAGESVRLDIVRPRGKGTHPLVIFIHGGGWTTGSKDDSKPRNTILRLAALGYVAASLDYRMAPSHRYPAPIEDVRCAVRWLRANAERYSIDPSRIAAIGTSAGGHLALMLANASDAKGFDASCPLDGPIGISGAVSAYGPTDLRSTDGYGPIGVVSVRMLLGGRPEGAPREAKHASPIVHVDPSDPPQLFVHGLRDTLVQPVQSRRMHAALQAAGVQSELVEVSGAPHGFAPITDDPDYRASTCAILEFLADRLAK